MIKISIEKSLIGAEGPIDLSINQEIEHGSFVTLYGPSGSGKTSTLKMLAGLMNPDSGNISVSNENWYSDTSNVNIPPQKRSIGYVFQDYALFPNMTVKENLLYALGKNESEEIVSEIIKITALDNLKDQKPHLLSGGQQQRVALARAIVRRPKLLLLDEPLSALDIQTRLDLQNYLKLAHERFNLTTIMVSHDIAEITKLANKVLVLEKGQIIKSGSPDEVFLDQSLTGKFKFYGDVLKIEKEEIVYIVTVIVQNNIVKVIAQEDDIAQLKIGDKVTLASKAFNPMIFKIEK